MSRRSATSVGGAATLASTVTFRSETPPEPGQAIQELIVALDLDEFTSRFLASRIDTLCPVRPALFVLMRPGGASIAPVCSTIRALRIVMGSHDWSVRTGGSGRSPSGWCRRCDRCRVAAPHRCATIRLYIR
jgi:hypothetical protein